MKCFYYIKLPNGGEVEFPADFTRIIKDTKLENLIKDFENAKITPLSEIEDSIELEKEKEIKNEIVKKAFVKIRNYINSGLSYRTERGIIDSITFDSEKSFTDQFVEKINSRINEELTITNVGSAIFKLLKSENEIYKINKKGIRSKIDLNTFLKELNQPIEDKYFYNINIESIIGMSTVSQEIRIIDEKIDKLEKVGQNTDSLQAFRDILSRTFPNKDEIRSNKMFFNATFDSTTNISVVIKDESSEYPMIFYNDSNELSVFLGLFNYIASSLDENELLDILTKYNETTKLKTKFDLTDFNPSKFFLGYINEEEKFVDPQFNQILTLKTGTKEFIDKIIDLIADKLILNYKSESTDPEKIIQNVNNERKNIINNFRLLFKSISPEKYGQGLTTQLEKDRLEFEVENKANIEELIERRKDNIKELILKENINFHYSRKEVEFNTVEDLQEWASSNVERFNDMLSIPVYRNRKPLKKGTPTGKDTFTINVVPTYIARTDLGIKIEGFYSDNGIIRDLTPIIITPDHQLFFRKLENPNASRFSLKEDAVSLNRQFPGQEIIRVKNYNKETQTSKYLPVELTKSLLRRGARVTYTYESMETKGENKGTYTTKEATVIAKAVFPGHIILNDIPIKGVNPLRDRKVSYENVKEFEILYDDLADDFTQETWEIKWEKILKSLVRIQKTTMNYLPIKSGDYVKIVEKKSGKKDNVRYNKVAAVDGDDIYIIVKSKDIKDTKVITQVRVQNRKDIEEMFTERISVNIQQEMIDAFNEYVKIYENEQSVREASYSYFLSQESAKDGDLVIIPNESGEGGDIFKIISKKDNYGIRSSVVLGSPKQYEYQNLDLSKAVLFMTKRDIAADDARTMADVNNFRIVAANDVKDIETERFDRERNLNFKLIPMKYVIPKFLKGNTVPKMLPSGNFDVGSIRWGTQMENISDEFIDVTDQLLNVFNRLHPDTKGKQLFLLQKEKGEYIQRYNKRFHEYILQDEKGQKRVNYEKFKDHVSNHVYFSFAKDWHKGKNKVIGFSNKLFRVISYNSNTNEAVLEYSGIENYGKIITIRKPININEAFEQQLFKAMYVLKDTKKHRELEAVLEKKPKKSQISEREELVVTVGNKLVNLFGIETYLSDKDPSLEENKHLKNKKAWIEPNPDGPPSVVINMFNSKTKESDVVHEYLHLFLIALRYSGESKLYDEIIESYRKEKLKGETLNAFKVEEKLVDDLAEQLLKDGVIYQDYNIRENIFDGIIKGFSILSENVTQESFKKLNINDLESLLSYNMKDLPWAKRKKSSFQINNPNLVFFDANFRDWLQNSIKKGTVKIKCTN